MRNIVKYDATTHNNSIKSGNFNLGVNDTSSNLTGFHNGITPINGGYTIYINKASNGPSIYSPKNDDELIDIVKHLSGTVYSVNDALNWVLGQSTMTVVNHNYPNIVTDGLVLNLDAGFVSSYPKNGTTWSDLSGEGNNGTLYNGVGYNSDNEGSLVFDGTNDYVTLPSNIGYNTNVSSFSWYKSNGLPSNGYHIICGDSGLEISIPSSTGQLRTGIETSTGRQVHNFGSGLTDGEWHYIGFTFDGTTKKSYIDGVEVGSISVTGTLISSVSTRRIGTYTGGYYANGNMFSYSVYDRSLSLEEVQQNYYAGLERLTPKDDLVLSLDAQNTNLYATSPTTAYDVSGDENNGSLLNGVSITSEGGVSWDFDGVNDRIETSFNTLTPSTTWNVWVNRTSSIGNYNMIMGMYLPYFNFRPDGGLHFSNNILGQKNLYASPNLSNNTWYFLSFVSSYSGGNTTMSIYVNGVFQTSATYSGQQPTSTNHTFRIGTWQNSGNYPFYGKISDASIHHKALTTDEILTIYNSTKSRYE